MFIKRFSIIKRYRDRLSMFTNYETITNCHSVFLILSFLNAFCYCLSTYLQKGE
jgi:hypothetical protein